MNLPNEKQIVYVVRWIARVVGVLVLCEVVAFAIGEGTASHLILHLREILLGCALWTMIAGAIVAWKREGLGSLLILGGFVSFILVNGLHRANYIINPIFGPFLIAGLLFLFCWWRTPKK